MNANTSVAVRSRSAKAGDPYAPDAAEVLDALARQLRPSSVIPFDEPQLDDLGITGQSSRELGLTEQSKETLLLDDLGITGAPVLETGARGRSGRRAVVRAVEGTARTTDPSFVLEDLDGALPPAVALFTACFWSEGVRGTERAA
ncbi:hypothetical protein ABT095_05685 [Kitasatospora sp. NPDC002227]|uniref:hypothetical protein n=1 Tax=Kitasatospora sp. NPDC002227 TaxID=3154773 RepID=UPI003316C4E6